MTLEQEKDLKEEIKKKIQEWCNDENRKRKRKSLYNYLNAIFGTNIIMDDYPKKSERAKFACSLPNEVEYVVNKYFKKLSASK